MGSHVSASAEVSADVPLAAEHMVYHGSDGATVPGVASPATNWYFANGNTSRFFRARLVDGVLDIQRCLADGVAA